MQLAKMQLILKISGLSRLSFVGENKYNLYKNILLVLNSEIGKKIKLNEMWDEKQLGERNAKGELLDPPR